MPKPEILVPRILCGNGVEECEEDGGGQGRRTTDDEEFLNPFIGSKWQNFRSWQIVLA